MVQDSKNAEWMIRATAYELAALAFMLPTRELGEALVTGEYAAATEEVFAALGVDEETRACVAGLLAGAVGKDGEEEFRSLRREHTRLFIGAKKPPITPYVGVHAATLRGQDALLFVGKESMEIERFMHRYGINKDFAAGQANDPLDHIGTVCEFLKFMCLVNAKAIKVSEETQATESDIVVFLATYISEYAEWFATEVTDMTVMDEFKAFALMLKTIVQYPLPC